MAILVTDNADALAAVARFYGIVFDREADGNGIAFWAEQVASGAVELEDVATAFLRVREGAGVLPDTLDDAEFAAALVARAFGREATAEETAQLEAELAAGTSRGALLAQVAQDAEAQAARDVVGDTGLSIADFETAAFRFGVASGDPDATSVVLWTHARPLASEGAVPVTWEVATDAGFSDIVASGEAVASLDDDYTVKVIADGLAPGAEYFYRFSTRGETSPVGQTSTLPESGLEELVLAVFSCSNFPAGYFNPYAAAVERGFDISVHLGDFIYENGLGGFATDRAVDLGRVPQPLTEIVTAEDYSLRYQTYMRDTDLQAVRAEAPMIAMWDDHETANDSWETGAEAHDPATEGPWEDRRDAALEAYYNWMPIREPASGDLRDADRSFDFGDLATLHMLETRLQARDETRSDLAFTALPAKVGSYLADPSGATFAADLAQFPELVPEGVDPTDPEAVAALASDQGFVIGLALTALLAEAADPAREMIGADQLAEFAERVEASDATWQIVGSQTLMARMTLPQALLLDPAAAPAFAVIAQKVAAGAELTETEQALLAGPRVPYNLDAWDGYAAEREALLDVLRANDANAIVIAGDTHNSWFSEVTAADGETVAFEFGGPGVSSPGLELALGDFEPELVAALFVGFIEDLAYANTRDRGYMELTVTPEAVTTDFVHVDRVDALAFTTVEDSFTVGIELFA